MPDQALWTARRWRVPEDKAGIRLDAFARYCLPHLSRRQLETAVRDKLFLINDRLGKKGDRLKAGDILAYQGPTDWLHDTPHPDARCPLSVAYEDDSVLIVDKPAGMATHGFSARDRNTLANLLLATRPALMSVGNSRWQPGLVHRLDMDTSGLVLVAKTQSAFEHLRLQFRGRWIEKKYWALVWGSPELEGEVAYPLVHDPGDKRRNRLPPKVMIEERPVIARDVQSERPRFPERLTPVRDEALHRAPIWFVRYHIEPVGLVTGHAVVKHQIE